MISMENENNDSPTFVSVLPELDMEYYSDLPNDPRQLLSEHERQQLYADLARLANLRQCAEAESHDIPMA